VPFYVAAPASTFDLGLPSGDAIPIEERAAAEVSRIGDMWTAPEGAAVFNPAFDVTPADLVTALITDRGVLRPPYGESIAAAIEREG
jgi:methylthioribose-1-phosphate isomerase